MIRRLPGQVYGLFAAAVLGAVLFLVVSPLLMLMPTLPLRRRVGRAGVRAALALALVPFRVRGLENLPAGACVVAANHASYLDGPLLTAALPERFTFVVQDGAEDWPYVGRVIRRMGVSFISRTSPRQGARQMRALIRRLQNGESLAVFPEGTFERRPGLLPFRNGVFMVAAHAGVPVVPAVIRGTRTLFGEGQRLPQYSRVEIEFLPAIRPGTTHRDEIARLREATRAAMLPRLGEPDGGAQDNADE